jgi:hypothetical protein
VGDVAELRIADIPAESSGPAASGGDVAGRAARRVAVAEFGDAADSGDGERIRWYLEDYAEFPTDRAAVTARDAEARLAQAGTEPFGRVFSGADAVGIWERARDAAKLGLDRDRTREDHG